MLVSNLKTLSADLAQRWGIDLELALTHARYAAEGPDLSALWEQVFHRPPAEPADVDEDLYGGFVGKEDRRLLDTLRRQLADDDTAAAETLDELGSAMAGHPQEIRLAGVRRALGDYDFEAAQAALVPLAEALNH
jgi:hypothetical protein